MQGDGIKIRTQGGGRTRSLFFSLNFILSLFVTNLRVINYRPVMEEGWGDNFKLLGLYQELNQEFM